MIGGIGHINRIGDSLQEGGESALLLALFGEAVELLLGSLDLIHRGFFDIHGAGAGGDFITNGDQITAESKIVNNLCIIPRIEERNGSARQPCEIGRAAQFSHAGIPIEIGFQRHRGGETVLFDAPGSGFINSRMQRVIEVFGFKNPRNPFINLIIYQQRPEKRLLCLDIMGRGLNLRPA